MPRIALIGYGYWGRNLARVLYGLEELLTVWDLSQEAVNEAVKTHRGVKLLGTFDDILGNKSVEGVVLATPAATHYELAKRTLLAGKDVFVEKPLALSVAEGEELVELAEGHVLMVGHVLEHHPAITKLKELVSGGEMGKILYLYSNRLNLGKFRAEEDVLWSFAPHDISVMLTLLNETPREVVAKGGYYLHRDIADITLTMMGFADGVESHIFVNWLHPYKRHELIVIGSEKMAVFDDTKEKDKLVLYNHDVKWVNRVPVPREGQAEAVEISSEEPLVLECQDFIKCMKTRERPLVDGRKGLQVLKVLEACRQSMKKNGKAVVL